MLAWVFFRAQSITEAVYVFTHMFNGFTNLFYYIKFGLDAVGIYWKDDLAAPVLVTAMLFVWDYLSLKRDLIASVTSSQYYVLRYAFYFMLMNAVMFLRGVINGDFVYFQF